MIKSKYQQVLSAKPELNQSNSGTKFSQEQVKREFSFQRFPFTTFQHSEPHTSKTKVVIHLQHLEEYHSSHWETVRQQHRIELSFRAWLFYFLAVVLTLVLKFWIRAKMQTDLRNYMGNYFSTASPLTQESDWLKDHLKGPVTYVIHPIRFLGFYHYFQHILK